MQTRVQQRVLYSESAQVKLGGGRGRFDDKKIRVGPAYQAVIPVLGSWSNADETARAGYAQAQEECPHGPVMARTKQVFRWSYAMDKARVAAREAGATPDAVAAAGAAAKAAEEAGATPAAAAAAGAAAAAATEAGATPAAAGAAATATGDSAEAAQSSTRRSTRQKRTPAVYNIHSKHSV